MQWVRMVQKKPTIFFKYGNGTGGRGRGTKKWSNDHNKSNNFQNNNDDEDNMTKARKKEKMMKTVATTTATALAHS